MFPSGISKEGTTAEALKDFWLWKEKEEAQ